MQNFYGQTEIYLQFKYCPDCSILELGQSILHLQLHLSLLLDTNIFVFNNFAQLFYVAFLLTIIFLIIFTLNHINRINTYIELNNLNSLQSSFIFHRFIFHSSQNFLFLVFCIIFQLSLQYNLQTNSSNIAQLKDTNETRTVTS